MGEKRGRRGLRVGFFGTFYPDSRRVGGFSTGVVAALLSSEVLSSITIFAQDSAFLPGKIDWSKATMENCWRHDDPRSLLKALLLMLRKSSNLDAFLFNTYVTAFGKRALANVAGLLMPPIVTFVTRKPVVVYFHNFLETQEVSQLGYHPSNVQRWGVRLLERLLLATTRVVVPLESQRLLVSEEFGVVPSKVFVPFAEPFGLSVASQDGPKNTATPPDDPTKILLLGVWGPQKDLDGAIEAIRSARARGSHISLSMSGAINPNFPEYKDIVSRVVNGMDPSWFTYLGDVDEAEVLRIVRSHDLLILPYRTSGGYSGAMSVGAYCGIGIIAYNLDQLRETARELGVHPTFVRKGDVNCLADNIVRFCSEIRRFRDSRSLDPRESFDPRVRDGAERLLDLMRNSE